MKLPPLSTFKKKFAGEIILPGDPTYEAARATFIKKGSPALIVFPTNAVDIQLALQLAQQNKLTISVRSGGHSGAGLSTNEGGMIIDLSSIKMVEVLDESKRLVRVGAGARWGAVAERLQSHHLAISSGDTKTVGVGGLTLGGGIGWLVRKVGLTIDTLVAAEVVTADGQILQASSTENFDLFWAIRGGGGNFGIVTHFDFVAEPLTQVFAGSIMFELKDVGRLLAGWRDYMRIAPVELNTMFTLMPAFAGNQPMVMVTCCYGGDDEVKAQQALAPLRKLGTVINQTIAKKEYAQVLEEAHAPQGVRVVVNNGFVKEFSDELIKVIVEAHTNRGNFILQIRSLGGAMNQVPAQAMAFAHRDCEALLVSPTFVSSDATLAQVEQAQAGWSGIKPFTTGCYVNFLSEINPESVRAAFPAATYNKLVKLKQMYDPDNTFNQNCNIPPVV